MAAAIVPSSSTADHPTGLARAAARLRAIVRTYDAGSYPSDDEMDGLREVGATLERTAREAADVAGTLRGLHQMWDVGSLHADDAARVELEAAIAALDRLAGFASDQDAAEARP